jgi:hypothetical protein
MIIERRRLPDRRASVTSLDRLLTVFRARCEARALLFATGELDLHEAVDGLQFDAVANGLVDEIGQDAVQRIMADAFAVIRGRDG